MRSSIVTPGTVRPERATSQNSEAWDGSSATLQYDEQDDTFYLHVTLKNPDYVV